MYCGPNVNGTKLVHVCVFVYGRVMSGEGLT